MYSCPLFYEIFGIEPLFVPVAYSNKGLFFFQGGCLWFGNEFSDVKIQLRASLKEKQSLFGLYRKEEIIAHELVHAYRWKLEEPIFEEVLAYQTASSAFRRFFGPLFQNEKEAIYFLASYLFASLGFFFEAFLLLFFLVPFFVTFFFLFRLFKKQKIYRRCVANLVPFLEKKARGFTLALFDQEIILLSKMNADEVEKFIDKKRL